jgi:dihydroorotate dehydrogenase
MRAPHDRNDGVAFDVRQVVGGILSGADARPLVDAGVAPTQLCSGLVNRGLALIRD